MGPSQCGVPTGGLSPQEGCPHSPQPRHPRHLLRLCSKDDQLFISSMARVPCPPPQASAQAAGGAQDRSHTPAEGGTAVVLSRRRVTATILLPFNSACVAPCAHPPPPRRPGWSRVGELCFSLPSLLLPPCT